MAKGLKDQLERLLSASQGSMAAVIGNEGTIIQAASNDETLDLEAIAALAASTVGVTAGVAAELNRGSLNEVLLHFDHDLMAIKPLESDLSLVVVAPITSLGIVRYAIRKYQAPIAEAVGRLV
jgi:predicted regulator of Ras-like GTPase activity (Roadblock/LC7/MglB family)